MKSKLTLLILILALSGVYIGYRMWNKPHLDIASAGPAASLTASELLAEYQSDESAANAKYLNKVISINGVIEAVSKEADQVSIRLATEDVMATVICNLDPFSSHAETEFVTGRNINLKGVCSGILTDVVLDRCVVINPSFK
ncbi:MAG TPA: hypothetical protein PKL70_16665 [Saprospiraceae bacterium]|nr:hypothetical protein [Saprospiraceae bacterium]